MFVQQKEVFFELLAKAEEKPAKSEESQTLQLEASIRLRRYRAAISEPEQGPCRHRLAAGIVDLRMCEKVTW